MNTKKVIAAVVLSLFTIPAIASAYTYDSSDYPGRLGETLVEGHTVFAVLQKSGCIDEEDNWTACPSAGDAEFDISYDIRANVTIQRLGTAVAVLVRDRAKRFVPFEESPRCDVNRDIVTTILYENPGVLWFNDQFLVGDDLDIIETHVDANVDVCLKEVNIIFDQSVTPWRYPCGGWVLATQAGNPDPRNFLASPADPNPPPALMNYQESYRIVDPNSYVWSIDKYNILPVAVGLDVPAQNSVTDLGLDDDTPAFDNDDAADGDLRVATGSTSTDPSFPGSYGYYLGGFNMWSVPVRADAYGWNGAADPNPPGGTSCAPYVDNAAHDPVSTNTVPLPYHDNVDNTQRLYNAVLFFFFEDLVGRTPPGLKIHGAGAPNNSDGTGCEVGTEWECGTPGNDGMEGNSHAYNPIEADSGSVHIHPTANVDLYWHNDVWTTMPASDAARKYVVYDTVGSAAPFHAHDPNEAFDDRVSFTDACGDLDYNHTEANYVFNGGGTYTGTSTYDEREVARHGEGETAPGDGDNDDDCTGYYDGGSTGWDPSGEADDGSGPVPTEEYY